jgi:hypothetical protein
MKPTLIRHTIAAAAAAATHDMQMTAVART